MTKRMTSDMDHPETEPKSLRLLKNLVNVMLVVMIVAVITITTLFVMRFTGDNSASLGTDFLAVRNGDVIEIYRTDTGELHQTIPVPPAE
ncbi:MAG: DUF6476 family protein [Pseudomonadota bacterium]